MSQDKNTKAMDQLATSNTEAISYLNDSNLFLNKDRVTVRLIECILYLPEEDQRNLLKELESNKLWEQGEGSSEEKQIENNRKHPRKTSLIAVDCSTHNVCFTNFIQDISAGGVFIETNAHFYVGQELKMNFSLSEIENSISVKGEVIRVNAQGIGVKFVEGNVNNVHLHM